MRRLAPVLAAAMLGWGAAHAADAPGMSAADAVARIKAYKFEVKPVEYRGKPESDPFRPGIPLRAAAGGKDWKVRIKTLKLSSVIVGKQRVAVFKESIGPTYSYVLVNGVLVGPDHKPIPGIEGFIEDAGRRGEYRVTLRQGVESVVHSLGDEESLRRRSYGNPGGNSTGTDNTGTQPEESE